MSEAVRRCCLGWKCDARYVRGGIQNRTREYDVVKFTPEEDCGSTNAMQ